MALKDPKLTNLGEAGLDIASFKKKLAKALVAAGIAASAVTSAQGAGPLADMLKSAEEALSQSDAMVQQAQAELGLGKTAPAAAGTTRDVIAKTKDGFKKAYAQFASNLDDNYPQAEKIMIASIRRAAQLLKGASDWQKEKTFVYGNIKGLTGYPMDSIKEVIQGNPDISTIIDNIPAP